MSSIKNITFIELKYYTTFLIISQYILSYFYYSFRFSQLTQYYKVETSSTWNFIVLYASDLYISIFITPDDVLVKNGNILNNIY